MSMIPAQRGLFFEEFQAGQHVSTPGRTITESDIVAFAGLSGDYNLIHTDAEYSRTTQFGQRVAHGLLCLSIASGLATRSGIMEGTVMAFREINNWKFVKPVFIGDTIHVEMDVTETKAFPRLGSGAVFINIQINNQVNEVVMKGVWTALIMSKPS
jgi:3-hydroxybutyryl-CoA dehydratase